MVQVELVGGQVIEAHSRDLCEPPCAIHSPSNHRMASWRQHWRNDRSLMERICEHGVGHPDPDHIARIRESRGRKAANAEAVHGCDGCCGPHITIDRAAGVPTP